jgi:hypothetical protein
MIDPSPWDAWHGVFQSHFSWIDPSTEVTNTFVQKADESWSSWVTLAAREIEGLTGVAPPPQPFTTRRTTVAKATEIRPCPEDLHRPRHADRVRRFEWAYRRLAEIAADQGRRFEAAHGKALSTGFVQKRAPEEWQPALCRLGMGLRGGEGIPSALLQEMAGLAREHGQGVLAAPRRLKQYVWDRHLEAEAARGSRWLHSFTKPAE